MLKKTRRTGYQFLGSGGESVADHSFRTAVIGYVLASKHPESDRNKVISMCLFHDFPEARTGDHNYVNKKYVFSDEEKAMKAQLNGLEFGDEIMALIDEFNAVSSLEARLAKDADQLDLIMELKEQLDLGNSNARDWLFFAEKRLMTETAKMMSDEILKTESSEWWFDKQTDWWINGQEDQDNN